MLRLNVKKLLLTRAKELKRTSNGVYMRILVLGLFDVSDVDGINGKK